MIGLVARSLAKAFRLFHGRKTCSLHCFGCNNSEITSAMDHSPVQTCVLKMNVKCENCQEKVKKTLQKIHGVHSINIDSNEAKVTVSSTVDPHLFIAMLARAGQKAELLWEPTKPQAMNNLNQVEHRGKKMQFTPSNTNGLDCDNKISQLAQLEEFAKIPGLKQMELDQSGNIKMIFRSNDDLESSSGDAHYHVKIKADEVHGPQVQAKHEVADEITAPTPPPAAPLPPLKSHCGDAGAGSSSVHWSHCRPEVKFACSEGSFGIRYMEEPIRPVPYYAPPPPHFVHPFTPPSSYRVHRRPPPLEASPLPYPDDNSACSVM